MNEKEWLDYFETINNRKPTEEEIQQAKANGEFISQESKDEGVNPQQAQLSDQVTQAVSQVAPAKTGLSKKAKIIIASVVGAIVLVALSFGGYAFMHLQGGKIPEGTYLLETYRFYHKDKKKMVDGMESFKESGLEAHDFVKVKGNNVKFYFWLCHNKQLINSHFYRGVSELPYKLLFAVIYTHLEFRYEVSHTITSHHVHHFHQTRIPDGTLLDYMVQYRKPLFPQFFLYPKKFLPENNPHHKEFHLRPYIQNNANQ